jgi:hypothetical protein
MELSPQFIREMRSTSGLLYPIMVIAAIAVIVFSILGIASMAGWMPHAMVGTRTAVAAQTIQPSAAVDAGSGQASGTVFKCAECGVIETIREIDRRGSLGAAPVAAIVEPAQPVTTGL